jgi:rhamnulokinase
MPAAPRSLYLAAVDLGATSGRVILGSWKNRRLELREVHRFPNAFRSLGTHDYWDVPGLWAQIQAGLRAAAAALPKGATLASVGVDCWGVDHVLLDRSGRLVFPTHAYRDARTQPGLKKLARNRADLGRIYAATGIPNVFYNTSLQLAETVASQPWLVEAVDRCLFLPDYFNHLLGGRAANELTIASTSQLLSVRGRAWSAEALGFFGVPAKWFGRPVAPGTDLGGVKSSDTLGGIALAGTRVIAVPGHDTACAYDAMPAAPEGGDLFLSSGTWSLVGFESQKPLLGAGALAARVANERTGDGGYRPLTNVIGLWLLEGVMKDFASRPETPEAWAALIATAEALPAPGGFLDVADPVFTSPSSMKAVIDGHLAKRGLARPGDLAGYTRLICDSLGRGHAEAMRRFEIMAGRKFQRILIVGGGSRNRLLCQATADAAGVPVVSFALEGTAVGNLARQLIALGAVSDLAAFRELLGRRLEQTVYAPRG